MREVFQHQLIVRLLKRYLIERMAIKMFALSYFFFFIPVTNLLMLSTILIKQNNFP